ncbi:MAG: hypothetical protein JNL01_16420 [Bdellovibrionales bacterium]|nr:hypothetical protein [Bdellovibrionales bacterium]
MGFITSRVLSIGFAAALAFSAAAAHADSIQFCSLTGADDPIMKVFKRHFSDGDSVTFQNIGPAQSAPTMWLKRACQTKVSCDVLVLNTELLMGGKQKNRQFPLKQLFTGATKEDCPGVLAKPVQVFLVGNNTLDSAAQGFFKDGKIFSPITEVYGFKSAKSEARPMNEALEDFVSETATYTQYLRTRMTARDQNCTHYGIQDVAAPKAIEGMDAAIALAWQSGGKPAEANRAIAASPSCPTLSK